MKNPTDLPKKSPTVEPLTIKQPGTKSKNHRAVKIIANVFFGLCLLILIFAIVVSYQAKKSNKAVEIMGWRPYLIATGSMEPTFAINGLVLTHQDTFSSAKIGDVVSFSAAGLNGQAALHRVVAITCTDKTETADDCSTKDRQLWVKGDNNPHPDGAPVTSKNYLGRAHFNTNMTAWWIGEIQRPNGWLRAILLPMILLILIYVSARWLIAAPITWRGKLIALSLVIFLVSASILASYTLYTVKQIKQTNADLAKISTEFANSDATKTWKVMGHQVIGRVEIPSLKLDYPIVEYDDSATTLNLAIAQFTGAPLNSTGNAVLIGHRAFGDSSQFNLFFAHLSALKQHDKIFVTNASRVRVQYAVQKFGEVSTNDDSILKQPDNKCEITLIAVSYTLGNRYMVQALAK
ncbi:signal peptidase I [Candidatus Saccharibacteria bacterium]|nr:signal peptidase I [Candidatus Saccharibacteria bacterium]